MKKSNNYKIIIATIISFIFLICSSFFVAFSSVKASAKEPIKKSLITPQNQYDTLTAVIEKDQTNNVITTTLYVTLLFDESDFTIFGAVVEMMHLEYYNGEILDTLYFDEAMIFSFDHPLVIGAENNNPYITLEYILTRYQTTNYYIPHITFYVGNDNYDYEYFQAATTETGAFTSSLDFYDPISLYNSITNTSYQLAYMLYSDSFESGYEAGKTEGYNQGYQTGKTDGYSEGYADGSDGSFSPSWLSALFSSLDAIFQVEIFPSFKLWYLIGAPLMVALVIAVLKFLR